MFEEFIEFHKKTISASITHTGDFVYLRDLLQDNSVPGFLKRFADAEVEWWIYFEQVKRRDNPRFDLAIPELLNKLHHIDDYYKYQARFNAFDETHLVDACITSYINILCRPRIALKSLIYQGESARSIYEISLRFSACSLYSYLEEGFKKWVENNATVHPSEQYVSVAEFKNILADIDNNYLQGLSSHEFMQLIEPIFEFFTSANHNSTVESVPAEALIIFLDDKGLSPLAAKIEELYESEDNKTYTRSSLLSIVDEIIDIFEKKESMPIQSSVMQPLAEITNLDKEIELLYYSTMSPAPISAVLISRHNFIVKNPIISDSVLPITSIQTTENSTVITDTNTQAENNRSTINKDLQKLIKGMLKKREIEETTEKDIPMRLFKSSFLGSMPIEKQLIIAERAFKGDLQLFRKLGSAIDKTTTEEAAILTFTAFSEIHREYPGIIEFDELKHLVLDFSRRYN